MGRIGLDQVFHTNVLVGSATRAQVFVQAAQDELVMLNICQDSGLVKVMDRKLGKLRSTASTCRKVTFENGTEDGCNLPGSLQKLPVSKLQEGGVATKIRVDVSGCGSCGQG